MTASRQKLAIVLFVLAIALLIYWVVSGHSIFTSTEHMVQVKDDLFGTTTEKWEKSFTPGLDVIGPLVGLMLVTGWWLIYSAKRKLKLQSV